MFSLRNKKIIYLIPTYLDLCLNFLTSAFIAVYIHSFILYFTVFIFSVLLFVDEADAFLRKRSKVGIVEPQLLIARLLWLIRTLFCVQTNFFL